MIAPAPAVTAARATSSGVPERGASASGDVALVAVEAVAVGARQGEGIALRTAGDEPRANRRVRVALAAARQYRAPRAQIEHGDHAQ